ncbi:AfsR/SARP family transcriptional regulator [Flindersiella endophytica]
MDASFGLLGPIGVRLGGGFHQVSGSHVRGLLAALLLRANLVVPQPDLIVDLWSGAPVSATDNLRKFAMRLRRQLTSVDSRLPGRLVTFRGGGYSIQLAAEELDLFRFREAWTNGRVELVAGRFHDALVQLNAAIGLWRGPAGVGAPTGGQLAVRLYGLNQEYVAAKEDLLATRLAVGDTVGLADQLSAHVGVFPTRERAFRLLLVSQYRTGQISEALATYGIARTRLIEELGVEPGESLRELHLAALNRHDTVLFDNRRLFEESRSAPARVPV